jgi:uncharacterized protein (TIGR00661 family)
MSQALSLKEYLEEAGHTVEGVCLGSRPDPEVPGYFSEAFAGRLHYFQSPYFLRTPNKKGIYIGRTLLLHLLRFPLYLMEARRIRKLIRVLKPGVVFNFYELVGALALRRPLPGVKRMGVGHHFFLHLDHYRCQGGSLWHRFLLKTHTRIIMRSCDRVLALSFREVNSTTEIQVVPPLVRRSFRDISYRQGERYLAYFLNEGRLYDLVRLARTHPDLRVDLFTSLNPGSELPEGIALHPFDEDRFIQLMASCRGLITSAGFDTVAEAAFHGIPLIVIPVTNHFEQLCNAADIARSGIGVSVTGLNQEVLGDMRQKDPAGYRAWAAGAGAHVLKWMNE